ncbi:MAG: hypothetical protein WC489_06075 [Patescibacteria group bacterium]|jgi:hypothetical protein
MRRDNKIEIIIRDANNRPIFTWRPGNGNVATGLRKGCEIAIGKLGLEDELRKQGVELHEKEQPHKTHHSS